MPKANELNEFDGTCCTQTETQYKTTSYLPTGRVGKLASDGASTPSRMSTRNLDLELLRKTLNGAGIFPGLDKRSPRGTSAKHGVAPQDITSRSGLTIGPMLMAVIVACSGGSTLPWTFFISSITGGLKTDRFRRGPRSGRRGWVQRVAGCVPCALRHHELRKGQRGTLAKLSRVPLHSATEPSVRAIFNFCSRVRHLLGVDALEISPRG